MSLSDRLDNLECRLAHSRIGACPACGGGSDARVRFLLILDDGTSEPAPGPCATCGRVPVTFTLGPLRLDGPRGDGAL
jgi:hypothetical protein